MNTLGVVLVEYNGIQDTLECIESILSVSYIYANVKIYVVDNNEDDSFVAEMSNGLEVTF